MRDTKTPCPTNASSNVGLIEFVMSDEIIKLITYSIPHTIN